MKRTSRKLALHRDTVSSLDPEHVGQVVGRDSSVEQPSAVCSLPPGCG